MLSKEGQEFFAKMRQLHDEAGMELPWWVEELFTSIYWTGDGESLMAELDQKRLEGWEESDNGQAE